MSSSPPLVVADRYRLVAPLGQGGMGRVWRATDVVLHREVAIKELVPPPGLTPGERQEMRERSLREARAIARLNNVNVVRVFDVLRTDADPWIVMEYVPSRSLQDTLASDGPFPPVKAAEMGLGVLNALRAAHRAGVVHRDVKPGNVLIGADGRVVLTDFGLATVPGDPNVTRTGLVLGSPAYIAPERARDGSAGPAADLWSLGATLYAAVEGASPFARPSAIATLAALATENPPPARNAGPLKPVLNGLLRKDPTHRINAEEAERLLLRATGRRSKLTFPMSPTMRRPGVGRERPALSPMAPGGTPVVPGPRPPVVPARPVTPPGPAPLPGRPAAGQGRPPTFAPGKAPVGRPKPETPTRVDTPKVVDKPIDATRIDSPPARDDRTAVYGTSRGVPTGTGQPPTTDATRIVPGPQATPSRPPRGVQAGFTAADVAANRRKQAAPEHERSLADATALIARVEPLAPPRPSPQPKPSADAPTEIRPAPAIDAPTEIRPAPTAEALTEIRPTPSAAPKAPETGSRADTAAEQNGSGTAAGPDTRTASTTQAGSDAAARTGTYAEPVPAAGSDAAARTGTYAEPVPAAGSVASTGTDTHAGADAGTAAGSVTSTGSDTHAEAGAAAEADTRPASHKNAEANAPAADARPEPVTAGADTPADSGARRKSVAASEAVAQAGSVTAAGSDAQAGSVTAAGSDAQAQSAAAAQLDASAMPTVDSAAEATSNAGAAPAKDTTPGGATPQADAPAEPGSPARSKSSAKTKAPAKRKAAAAAAAVAAGAAAAAASVAGKSSATPGKSAGKADDAQDGTRAAAKGDAVGSAVTESAATKGAATGHAATRSAATKDAAAGSAATGSAATKGAAAGSAATGSAATKGAAAGNATVGGAAAGGAVASGAAAEDAAARSDAATGNAATAGSAADNAVVNSAVSGDAATKKAATAGATADDLVANGDAATKSSGTVSSAASSPAVDGAAAMEGAGTVGSAASGPASDGTASGDAASKSAATADAATGNTAADTSAAAAGSAGRAAAGSSASRAAAKTAAEPGTVDDATPTTKIGTRIDAPARPDRTALLPGDQDTSVAAVPGLSRPARPAWNPMPIGPASTPKGVTVFGTRLTYRQAAIGAGIVLLVLVLLITLVAQAFGGDDQGDQRSGSAPVVPTGSAAAPTPGATTQPSSAAPSSAAASSAPPSSAPPSSAAPSSAPPSNAGNVALPTTWRVHSDSTGFKVPLPKSASIERRGSELYITWNNRLLLIDQTDRPKSDPLADWQNQERERANRDYADYRKVRLEPVNGYFKAAADWEFFYTTDNGHPQHAVKRNILVNDQQAYSLSWYVSPGDWAGSLNELKLIYQGFQPRQ